MKTIKFHSSVGIITNSSTVIYTVATEETIKAAIKLLEALGGNKDEFKFELHPGVSLLEAIMEESGEYLTSDMLDKLKSISNWGNRKHYISELILNKEIDCPQTNYLDMDYEWDLVVIRNGEPFNEFVEFFSSFDQEAIRNG